MFRSFIAAFLLLIVITLTGCCLTIECGYNDGNLKFRLMRDGKNALFGPDAFLTQEDLKLIIGSSHEDGYIQFDTSLQAIQVYVFTNPTTILEIENISSDTISITSEKVSNKGCCDEYRTTGVLLNRVMICEGACEGVIVVEI